MLLSEELEIKASMASVLEEMALIEDYFLEEFGIQLSETEELLEWEAWDRFKHNVIGVGGSKAITKNADGKYVRKGAAGLVDRVRRKIGGEGSKVGIYSKQQLSNMAKQEEQARLAKIGVKGKELEGRVNNAAKDAVRRTNSEQNVAVSKRNAAEARADARLKGREFKQASRDYNPNDDQSRKNLNKAAEADADAKYNRGLAKDKLAAAKKQLRNVRSVVGH